MRIQTQIVCLIFIIYRRWLSAIPQCKYIGYLQYFCLFFTLCRRERRQHPQFYVGTVQIWFHVVEQSSAVDLYSLLNIYDLPRRTLPLKTPPPSTLSLPWGWMCHGYALDSPGCCGTPRPNACEIILLPEFLFVFIFIFLTVLFFRTKRNLITGTLYMITSTKNRRSVSQMFHIIPKLNSEIFLVNAKWWLQFPTRWVSLDCDINEFLAFSSEAVDGCFVWRGWLSQHQADF